MYSPSAEEVALNVKGVYKWTEEEDRQLIAVVAAHGTKNFTQIAEGVPGMFTVYLHLFHSNSCLSYERITNISILIYHHINIVINVK